MGQHACWTESFSDWIFWTSVGVFLLFLTIINRGVYFFLHFQKKKTKNDFAAYVSASVTAVGFGFSGCIFVLSKQWFMVRLAPLGIFAYSFVDTLFWVIQNESYGLLIHHISIVPFCIAYFSCPDEILIFTFIPLLIEASNFPCVQLSYYAKVYHWRFTYYISGLCKLFLYPIVRLVGLPIYGYYFVTDDNNQDWVETECIILEYYALIGFGFLWCFSAYYYKVMLSSWKKYLYLQNKDSDNIDLSENMGGSEIGSDISFKLTE